MFRSSYIILRIQRLGRGGGGEGGGANSVDQNEAAHHEPPHLDLRRLQTHRR